MARRPYVLSWVASAALLCACIPRPQGGAAEMGAQGSAASPAPGENPFTGARLFVDPASSARRQVEAWRGSRPDDAAMIEKIAREPQSFWFGDWNQDVTADVDARMSEIAAAGALGLFVAYDIPHRDCGNHSAGGASAAEAYKAWIRKFARGIGGRRAVVILEPDALGLLKDCLTPEQQEERLGLLADAVTVLGQSGAVSVYIDAGNAKWQPPPVMAERLRAAGVEKARGFALNVSNFVTTEESVAYGKQISTLLSGKPFIVDTSRNGNGPTKELQWCNPDGRALGKSPTTETGEPLVDAYLWIKLPGESDGACNGGPRAGEWWPEYALGLSQRAKP
ncbi:glycoside hydrolase family 6 protein [Polyangium jinanense]|uniref:Glucanase n=2 Tax=Polyangium jinanense TaxID=2829994 RepID=A0A9X4AW78_9BACT|nr:glycoside hydrolase family 6 protein [Polyangium jinanense]MDC3987038.1 glycoside hydrolase family 6 protein [Polyangium jinanense]